MSGGTVKIGGVSVPESVATAKLLVVGAGGIGCELLKNLVLTGFHNIHIIDLDTIEVSNLNRQFLFHKQHVGKPKAQVAVESVLGFVADSRNITFSHSNVMNPEFDLSFFKSFDLVLNALDNRAARNHVNRMCLASDVPLVESGSAGYLGQVSVIKKGQTECYECTPKATQTSYPGCTIRNTPSEPIHCIVWSKHLFNQLFGAPDVDEDVSPDLEDPELQTENSENGKAENGVQELVDFTAARVSVRKWAENSQYDTRLLFQKFFHDDIENLLTMGNLWKKRQRPTALDWNALPTELPGGSTKTQEALIRDQRIWSPEEAKKAFVESVGALQKALAAKEPGSVLVWDKDNEAAVNFVTACSNLRSLAFGIQVKSRFDVKSMAGQIVPAIASTNAVVAAIIVMEALKILSGSFHLCRATFLGRKPNPRGKILVDMQLEKPRPDCYVCSEKPEVSVSLNLNTFTVHSLEEKVLKQKLSMVAPDVSIADGSGTVIISSEEGETTSLQHKTLAQLAIRDGTRLICDDFMQQYELRLWLLHSDDLPHDVEFQIQTDSRELQEPEVAKEEKTASKRRASSPLDLEAKKQRV